MRRWWLSGLFHKAFPTNSSHIDLKMADFSFYLFREEIQFFDLNMLPLTASLAGEVAVVFFAVRVDRPSVAEEGMDLSFGCQLIQKPVNCGDPYFWIVLGNLLI